jgi:hypothetical protein
MILTPHHLMARSYGRSRRAQKEPGQVPGSQESNGDSGDDFRPVYRDETPIFIRPL